MASSLPGGPSRKWAWWYKESAAANFGLLPTAPFARAEPGRVAGDGQVTGPAARDVRFPDVAATAGTLGEARPVRGNLSGTATY